jgi:hypothetical protein
MGLGTLGGGKAIYCFGIKTDHTGIVKADGTTAATAITDAELKLGADDGEYINTEYTLTPNAEGGVDIKVTTTQYDSAVKSYKDKYFPRKKATTSTTKPEAKSVTGFKIGGGTSSGNKDAFLILYAGNDGTNTIVKTYVVKWKNESLGVSMKGEEWNTYTLEGTAQPAQAAITIPAALFDATSVTVAAAQTHADDYYEGDFIFPTAS